MKNHINDFKDTASLLKNLDLLITIDSSIAHLAGALGIKTYLLLPKTSEWRWFRSNDKSLWYDSIKIFRQEKSGEWTTPIDRIIEELKNAD